MYVPKRAFLILDPFAMDVVRHPPAYYGMQVYSFHYSLFTEKFMKHTIAVRIWVKELKCSLNHVLLALTTYKNFKKYWTNLASTIFFKTPNLKPSISVRNVAWCYVHVSFPTSIALSKIQH